MLVAFDLDGTLEDSRQDMVLAIQNLRSELGLEPREDADLRPWVSKGMPMLYAKAFDDVALEDRDKIPKRYAAHYAQVINKNTVLYEGIAELLQQLSTEVTLAVVTNKPQELSKLLLRKLNIDQYFSVVVGGDTFEKAKPDPMMLSGALRQSGVKGDVVMVGDSAGDVQMSRSFGAKSIWCAWGYLDSVPKDIPDFVVTHPMEVWDCILKIRASNIEV